MKQMVDAGLFLYLNAEQRDSLIAMLRQAVEEGPNEEWQRKVLFAMQEQQNEPLKMIQMALECATSIGRGWGYPIYAYLMYETGEQASKVAKYASHKHGPVGQFVYEGFVDMMRREVDAYRASKIEEDVQTFRDTSP